MFQNIVNPEKTPLLRAIKLRITFINVQSFLILSIVALTLGLGFYVSSRSLDTTSDELTKVTSATALNIGVATDREELHRALQESLTPVRAAFSGLESAIKDILVRYNDKSVKISDFADVRDIGFLDETRSSTPAALIAFDYSIPKSCSDFSISHRRDIDAYLPPSEEGFRQGRDSTFYALFKPLKAVGTIDFRFTDSKVINSQEAKELLSANKNTIISRLYDLDDKACTKTSQILRNIAVQVKFLDELLDQRDSSTTHQGSAATNTASSSHDTGAVILLLTNKFGPLIIVFFFVSILVTMYKYNARLSSFYYGRLFAIMAIGDGNKVKTDTFSALSNAFSPDALDFGVAPKTPMDVAGEIATKVIEKLADKFSPEKSVKKED